MPPPSPVVDVVPVAALNATSSRRMVSVPVESTPPPLSACPPVIATSSIVAVAPVGTVTTLPGVANPPVIVVWDMPAP
ncbi:MAG TPA: hypothetical protein VGI87_04980 [Solirubrobacteraceae bacterium]|jgi:hypothetical protein